MSVTVYRVTVYKAICQATVQEARLAGMPAARRLRTQPAGGADLPMAETDADLDAQVRLALATLPQSDPAGEAIVTGIAKAAGYLDHAAQATLGRVGLTKEEFKVL